jgi:hypothetical protein
MPSLSKRPTSVATVLRGVVRKKQGGCPRVLLSEAASKKIVAVSEVTGIPVEVLTSSAIDALAVALGQKRVPTNVRDDRLRMWLNRRKEEGE